MTVDAVVLAGQTRLTSADQSFQTENLLIVEIALLLILDESLHRLVGVLDDLVGTIGKDGVEAIDEMHETTDLLIAHGNVARSLVGDMHVVSLLHESTDGAAHGDDIVIRMGREDDNPFWIGRGTLRTRGVVDARLTSWPTRNGMLQFVEDFDIDKSRLALELFHKMAETIIHIIFRGEFQQGFPHLVAKVNHLPTQFVVGHLNS